jgi:hypothetical protein
MMVQKRFKTALQPDPLDIEARTDDAKWQDE